jgi:hypothetical protein
MIVCQVSWALSTVPKCLIGTHLHLLVLNGWCRTCSRSNRCFWELKCDSRSEVAIRYMISWNLECLKGAVQSCSPEFLNIVYHHYFHLSSEKNHECSNCSPHRSEKRSLLVSRCWSSTPLSATLDRPHKLSYEWIWWVCNPNRKDCLPRRALTSFSIALWWTGFRR